MPRRRYWHVCGSAHGKGGGETDGLAAEGCRVTSARLHAASRLRRALARPAELPMRVVAGLPSAAMGLALARELQEALWRNGVA
jgi:hypothetical protein